MVGMSDFHYRGTMGTTKQKHIRKRRFRWQFRIVHMSPLIFNTVYVEMNI